MKTSVLALCGILSPAFGGAAVRKIIKLDRNLHSNKALLKHARPYKHTARRLEEEVEIDGSYNLKFSQCVEIKTADEDLFDEDTIAYAQAGQVVSSKSYVLFHLCQGDDCYYDADDDLYIVDLPTYLASIAQYHANKRNDYCEACENFEDYCVADEEEDEDEEAADDEVEDDEGEGDDEEDENDDEADEEDDQDDQQEDGDDAQEEEEDEEDEGDEERKLRKVSKEIERKLELSKRKLKLSKKIERKLKRSKKIERKLAGNYIDCDQCNTYECFVDEDDLDDNAQTVEEMNEEVSEWIGDLAGCLATGDQWNNMDVYVSAICSPYGDGVELGVFLNEDCTLYTSELAFEDVYNPDANQDDQVASIDYLSYAESFIKSAFSEVASCLQQEFDDPDEEENDDANEEQNYELNEYCEDIFDGDIVDFNNCEAEEEEEQNDDNQDDDYSSWYTYDMQEADDINEVCSVINLMEGEYSYVYDEEKSGSWYDRSRSGAIIDGSEGSGIILSPAHIVGIVAGVIVLFASLFYCTRSKKASSDSNEPVYQGGQMM